MRILPDIPVVDARALSPAGTAAALPQQMADLLRVARRRYTPLGLTLGDAVSRRWLARNANPYLPEIDATAAALGTRGAHLLNCSYEWACTTGCAPAENGGQVMVRVLDWDLDGLGRNVAAIRRQGPAGEWVDVGWPGFSGAITAMAPGRFSAAINQPPLAATPFGTAARHAHPVLGLVADWAHARPGIWRSQALPPAHLLRQVMDEAATYDEAVAMLSTEPLSTPALFTVAGVEPGQGCVIERTRDACAIRMADPAVATANHWVTLEATGLPRGHDSPARKAAMDANLAVCSDPHDLAWLCAPILNGTTRIIAVCDARSSRLTVLGIEHGQPATEALRLS